MTQGWLSLGFHESAPAPRNRIRRVLESLAAVLAGRHQRVDERLIVRGNRYALAVQVVFQLLQSARADDHRCDYRVRQAPGQRERRSRAAFLLTVARELLSDVEAGVAQLGFLHPLVVAGSAAAFGKRLARFVLA